MAGRDATIVIVGAGIAGLSAAHHLVKNGFNNVIVLEASDRIGGRINTVEFGDGIIELGANYIHGEGEDNSVYTLAKENGLITEPYICLNSEKIQWRTENGRVIGSNIIKQARDIFEAIEEELEDGLQTNEVLSCKKYIKKRIDDEMENIKKDEQPDTQIVLNSLVKEFGLFEGDDAERLSANLYPSGQIIGGEDITIPEGYSKVSQYLSNALPDGSLKLGKRVTKIKWNNDNDDGVEILCQNDKSEQTFKSAHVIITCSLGHLKQFHKQLFVPELPQWKINAIEKMGFGQVEAIFLSYEKPFWKKGDGCFQFAFEHFEEGKAQLSFKSAYWVREIPTATNVLLVWLHGEEAKQVHSLSKGEIASICTRITRNCLGNESIPEPTDIVVSSWSSDSLYLGAYSYYSTDSYNNCVSDIAKPIVVNNKPVLCFAGEATHEQFSSYAHGARSSGIREAEKLCKIYS